MSANLCDQVVEVTSNYLGPSAKRFIYRQVEIHLDKSPQNLKPEDVVLLAEWSKLALALVTNDKHEVDHFEADLLKLAKSTGQ